MTSTHNGIILLKVFQPTAFPLESTRNLQHIDYHQFSSKFKIVCSSFANFEQQVIACGAKDRLGAISAKSFTREFELNLTWLDTYIVWYMKLLDQVALQKHTNRCTACVVIVKFKVWKCSIKFKFNSIHLISHAFKLNYKHIFTRRFTALHSATWLYRVYSS